MLVEVVIVCGLVLAAVIPGLLVEWVTLNIASSAVRRVARTEYYMTTVANPTDNAVWEKTNLRFLRHWATDVQFHFETPEFTINGVTATAQLSVDRNKDGTTILSIWDVGLTPKDRIIHAVEHWPTDATLEETAHHGAYRIAKWAMATATDRHLESVGRMVDNHITVSWFPYEHLTLF